MHFLLEPLQFEYMRHALLVAILLGTTCAALSVYLLLKGWSLIGDGLAHASIPGVAIAHLTGTPYILGALASGLLAMGSIHHLSRHPALKQDAVIAFIYTSYLALGLLIISIHPIAISLTAIIYGNILAIANSDLIQTAIICCFILSYLALKWRDLGLILYDPIHARLSHSHPTRHNRLLTLALALTIITGIQSIGIILITALLILPGATARLLCRRLGAALLTAAIIGSVSAALGTYLSYYLDTITTASIVLLQSGIFFLTLLFTRRHA